MSFESQLRLLVLKKSLKKRAPETFPYGSSTDYYVPSIKTENDHVLVDRIEHETIFGRSWDGERFNEKVEHPIDILEYWEVRIARFLGYFQVDYDDYRSFWKGELTGLAKRKHLVERIAQGFYNATTSFGADRVFVLKKLTAQEISEAQKDHPLLYTGDYRSVVKLMTDVYGQRVYGHPAHGQISAKFRQVVESLVSSGELESNNKHDFRVTGKALVTIANFEKEERRHKDQTLHNWLIFILTAVLAGTALYEIFSKPETYPSANSRSILSFTPQPHAVPQATNTDVATSQSLISKGMV